MTPVECLMAHVESLKAENAALKSKTVISKTTQALVAMLEQRDAAGLAKYGVTLDRTDLTAPQWAQHGIEEALDLAGYLTRFKEESERLQAENATLKAQLEGLKDPEFVRVNMLRGDIGMLLEIEGYPLLETMNTRLNERVKELEGMLKEIGDDASNAWSKVICPAHTAVKNIPPLCGKCLTCVQATVAEMRSALEGVQRCGKDWKSPEVWKIAEDALKSCRCMLDENRIPTMAFDPVKVQAALTAAGIEVAK